MLQRMGLALDLGRLAEIAREAPTLAAYEREVLAVIRFASRLRRRDVQAAVGTRAACAGLDPKVRRDCAPYMHAFGAELVEVARVAAAHGGVAVDLDVLGMQRMERLSYYQRMMRPHGGRSTAMVYLRRRTQPLAALAIGRTRGSFRSRELHTCAR